MKIATIGIDISKNVFQIHGMDEKGRCVLTKRLSRDKFTSFMANLDPTLIGMEACGGSHHWARILKSQGYKVKLMSLQYVLSLMLKQTRMIARTLSLNAA